MEGHPHNFKVRVALPILELGLRVLTAITERRDPSPDDLAQLRKLVPDSTDDEPVDELACRVIEKAVRDLRLRAKAAEEQ
jgi:hypothetical protein